MYPSFRTMTFSGLMSRWMIRCSMRRRYSLRDLRSDRDSLADGQSSVLKDLPEGLAIDEFADDEARAVVSDDLVKGEDIRVIDRRDGLCLEDESLQVAILIGDLGIEHLYGDLASELRVRGKVNLARSPSAQEAHDLVSRDMVAGLQTAAGRLL